MTQSPNTACILFLSALIILTMTLAGCAPKEEHPPSPPPTATASIDRDTPTPPAVPERTFFTHTVRWPGETLSLIAWWYTGSLHNWPKLAEANPDLQPERIRIGDIILIPEDLMVKKEPLPKSFIENQYGAPADPGTDVNATASPLAPPATEPAAATQEHNGTADAAPQPFQPGTAPSDAETEPDQAETDRPAVQLYGPKE